MDVSALLAQAATLANAGQLDQAQAICRRLLAARPQQADAWHVLGVCLRRQGQFDEALDALTRAANLAPRNAAVQFELGSTLVELGRTADAAERFRRASQLDPKLQPAFLNLGTILDRQDRFEEALPWCRKAVELDPQCATARFNLANVLQSLRRLDEASSEFDEAVRLAPDFANAHWNGALCHLLAGRFAPGWREYEWRDAAGEVAIDRYDQPRWQGQPLAGKTLLVHAEQGLGDEILFASCLGDVLALAQLVIVVCEPRLAPIFSRSFPHARVYGCARRKDRAPAPIAEPIDFQIPAGSLPGLLRPDLPAFPIRDRFLLADERATARWRARIDELGAGLKVGISWRAGGKPVERRKRTTTWDDWQSVFAVPGVRFVNVQYGDCAAEIAAARERFGVTIHDWDDADPLIDLDGFAAKLAALDLVVSVGNATVHLAGALGVPAWAMLPVVPAWRWLIAGDHSPWYSSVRLYRQTRRGGWDDVFARVAGDLAARAGHDAPIASAPRPALIDNPSAGGDRPATPLYSKLSEVTARVDEAQTKLDAGDWDGAEAILRDVLHHAPRDVRALVLMGSLARKTGRGDLAVRSLGRAASVADKDVRISLQLAEALAETGRADDAIAELRRAAAVDCNCYDAHFALGHALRNAGLRAEALAAFQQAVRCRSDFAKPYNALGGVYSELLRFDDAVAAFRRAIELKPDYMAAYNNLGQALEFRGELTDAVGAYQQALRLDPVCRQARENLESVRIKLACATTSPAPATTPPPPAVPDPRPAASARIARPRPAAKSHRLAKLVAQAVEHYNQDHLPESEALAKEILAIDPDSRVALRILGVTSRKAGDPTASLAHLRRGVASHPNDYGLRFELGVSLFESNRPREALDEYLAVTRLRPDFQPAYVNVTAVLEQQERYEEVIPWAKKALALKSDCVLSNYNLANALRETAQIEEAIEYYRRAVESDRTYVKAHWNLGMSYLLAGDYEHGWPLFEHRGEIGEVAVDAYPQPRWIGESLADKTILLHGEQGIGDEVLFSSCFPDVIERAGQVVIVCEPRLVKIFSRSFPTTRVYGFSRRKDGAPCEVAEAVDYQIGTGSLPQWFRPSRESFPQRANFLVPDEADVARWRERLAQLGSGLKVGVSWLAGGKPQERRKRSIPLVDWAPLLSIPGVQWVNLQYGDGSEEIAEVREQLGIDIRDFEDGDPLVDMDAFAAKIKALDLVVSIGNATVHLAGAVGAPTWTILPLVPSWRWMIRGEQNPWYASVRLFRQTCRGEWHDLFARLVRELCGRLGLDDAEERIRAAGLDRPTPAADEPTPTIADDRTTEWLTATEYDVRTMVDSVGPLMEQAEQALAAHDLPRAEAAFREVLRIAPRQYQALHGLGVVARQTGRNELAIRSFQRSLAMIEPIGVHHFNYAGALAEAGRLAEAEQSYRRAIGLDGQFVLARIELGRTLVRTGRHADAERELRKALAIDPNDAGVCIQLGACLATSCRLDEAIELYEHALQLKPESAGALLALGEAYLEDQRYDEAIGVIKRAADRKPHDAAPRFLLGRALLAAGRRDEATEAFEGVLACSPRHAGALLELGHLARGEAQFEVAESYYRQAVAAAPNLAEGHCSLGVSLADQGRLADAVAAFGRGIALKSDYASAHLHRALALVQQGQFAAGWDEYEWRWHTPGGPRARSCFSQPPWDGSPMADKTLLIHGEQGVGDEIMFATCYPDAIALAGHTVITCEPRLQRLLARSLPNATVVAVPRGREQLWRMPSELAIDAQIPSGSLPKILRRGGQNFPRAARLLTADAAQVAAWRARLATLGAGLKVGISWRAGSRPEEQRVRGDSLTPWLPLLRTPGVRWIDLQYGDCGDEVARAAAQTGAAIHRCTDVDHFGDLDRLAALLSSLDLLIAVGNTTVHLAGALGVPTWCLLPPHGGWRWLADRADSPWYASVRLFRRQRLGEWTGVILRAREELLARLRQPVEQPTMRSVPAPHWPAVQSPAACTH